MHIVLLHTSTKFVRKIQKIKAKNFIKTKNFLERRHYIARPIWAVSSKSDTPRMSNQK